METNERLKNSDITKTKVKLNQIFECEGKLYSIALPKTPSVKSNLSSGRIIAEFEII